LIFLSTAQGNFDEKLGRRGLKNCENRISPHYYSFNGLYTQPLA